MATVDQSTLRPIVFYEFLQGHSARAAAANICNAFKAPVIHHSTVSRWFERFQSGEVSLKDEPRSGRKLAFGDDALRELLKAKPNANSRELASTLGCTHPTILQHLHDLSYRKVLSIWVPHQLSDSNKAARVSICESLLLRPHRKEFLKEVVTGDESWVLYVNHTRKRQWVPQGELPASEPKPDRHQRKVLLCCWWDSESMLYYELLPTNTTVTATLYTTQLRKLANVISQKRPQREQSPANSRQCPSICCKDDSQSANEAGL